MRFAARTFARLRLFLLLVLALFAARPVSLCRQQSSSPSPNAETPTSTISGTPGTASYRLSHEKYEKAVAFSRAGYRLYFLSAFWNISLILLLLRFRFFSVLRNLAESKTAKRLGQAAILVVGVFGLLALLNLPIRMYWHRLSVHYGQSVEPWGRWFRDWGKAEFLEVGLALLVVLLLFELIRRDPRRWWFYAWLCAIPCTLFLVFIAPLCIDPLFDKFTPLQKTHPVLTASIVALTRAAGHPIAQGRIFLMDASTNTKAINAYVTGLGTSKRIVIWDTSIAKTSPGELLCIVGHEMGHYVYHHVIKGVSFFLAMLLPALFLAHRFLNGLIRRWGGAWGIHAESDWAALGVLLLLLNVMSFLGAPVGNAFSRMEEHNADVYGLEIVQGLMPNANKVAADSFQVLGEEDLDDPHPSRFIVFWLYSHPPLNERLRFAHDFKPSQTNPGSR